MPRRDLFHDAVKSALIKDGWTITHDPYNLPFGVTNLYVDLGAEAPPLGAERAGRKIAVEVKSFRSPSPVADLEGALGQFVLYRALLKKQEPDRMLYLALSREVYGSVFREADAQDLISELELRLIEVDEMQEVVTRWIEP